MNDRELLELAAKAAGFEFEWHDGFGLKIIGNGWWDPIESDGDALRLACTLGLTVECDFNESDTCTVSQTRGEILVDESAGMVGEIIGDPDFAATRRAIVRAAAAIGQAMQ